MSVLVWNTRKNSVRMASKLLNFKRYYARWLLFNFVLTPKSPCRHCQVNKDEQDNHSQEELCTFCQEVWKVNIHVDLSFFELKLLLNVGDVLFCWGT